MRRTTLNALSGAALLSLAALPLAIGTTYAEEKVAAAGEAARCAPGRDHRGAQVPGGRIATCRCRDAPGHQSQGAADDQGRVRQGAPDLLRTLRRLSRRAAQGRHGQAADARHHAGQGHRLPQGVHRLRLSRRHAQLADLRRADREGSGPDGPLRPADASAATRVRHEGYEGDVEGHRAARAAAEEEDEQLQHRQHLLDHAARCRRSGADRRRHQEDHQHRQDRLRGAHLAHLGLRALPVS